MKLIILLVAAMAVAAYFLFFDKRPNKKGDKRKTAQEFINVLDISQDGIIETRDGFYIGYIIVSGRKTDLLSRREQQGLIDQQTAEVSTIASGWQILAASQPEDNASLIQEYTELLESTQDPIQKKLLREAIRYQNRLLLDGENITMQPQHKRARGAEEPVESVL